MTRLSPKLTASTAPHPHRTSDDVAEKILGFRRRFPHMGSRKIIARLAEIHPDIEWPSPSTAGDILCRANLVQPRERRTPPAHPLRVRSQPTEPNDLMTVDYKGISSSVIIATAIRSPWSIT